MSIYFSVSLLLGNIINEKTEALQRNSRFQRSIKENHRLEFLISRKLIQQLIQQFIVFFER